MSDEIILFPVKGKVDQDEKPVLNPTDSACDHKMAVFQVNLNERFCLCLYCKQKVSPMLVLEILAKRESRWHRFRERYLKESERLLDRKRTKCEHCNKMTRISSTKPRPIKS